MLNANWRGLSNRPSHGTPIACSGSGDCSPHTRHPGEPRSLCGSLSWRAGAKPTDLNWSTRCIYQGHRGHVGYRQTGLPQPKCGVPAGIAGQRGEIRSLRHARAQRPHGGLHGAGGGGRARFDFVADQGILGIRECARRQAGQAQWCGKPQTGKERRGGAASGCGSQGRSVRKGFGTCNRGHQENSVQVAAGNDGRVDRTRDQDTARRSILGFESAGPTVTVWSAELSDTELAVVDSVDQLRGI